MKIATYNVNGIRAALKKGLAEWTAATAPDVLCIQETKAHEEQVDMAELKALGYVHQQWHSATSRKGYSGVLTLSKVVPDYVQLGFGNEKYDREGRVVRTDFGDLTIFNCYFPNGGQGDERQNFKYEFLDDFLAHILELQKSRPGILVVGDYNIAHNEIDLHSPKTNHKNTGFLPDERKWMTEWFDKTGFIDTYRHLYPEGEAYSWWSYRANARNNDKGWRIDYHSLSPSHANRLVDVVHLKDALHSDHCPILLTLS
ncbi:exodeoxyribonuclease III [Neolewinella antarctica]|uniref:Exodeoxyribonuclease-3 n=1 Tax=Neolewinella antarctica TaxID=442734 RepID=A0ABX0XC41_9BACT|nr:exodeoxyribonuclease III [Neolewinella antarctica]NJC26342.1 exodeoxyribonuclease-3 [Neolewinella antarctica]